MVLPEGLRADTFTKSLQSAVDLAVVVVTRMICGSANGVLVRQDVADVTLAAVGVRHASSAIIILLAKLMTKGVGPPCFGDAEEEVRRHAVALEKETRSKR